MNQSRHRPPRRSALWLLALLLAACASPTPPGGGLDVPDDPVALQGGGASFTIQNTGSASLSWTITVANDAGNPQSGTWLLVDPDSGTLAAGQSRDVFLSLASGLASGSYAATLTVRYDGGAQSFAVSADVGGGGGGGFTLGTDGFSNTVDPGQAVNIPIDIDRSGYSGGVAFELFGAPEGLSGTFSPDPASGDQTTLSLTVADDVAAGDYTVAVRGTGGGTTAVAEVDVTVIGTTSQPTYSLSLSPATLTVAPGDDATSTVTVNRRNGFTSSVSLSVSGGPSGVNARLNPTSTSGTTATLAVEVSSSASPGSYTLTVTGQGGGKTRTVRLGLTVAGSGGGGGDGTIRGEVTTANADVPVNPPSTAALVAPGGERALFPAGQLIVAYGDDAALRGQAGTRLEALADRAAAVRAEHGLATLRALDERGTELVALPAGRDTLAAAEALSRDPRVRYAEPNYYFYPHAVPNDPQLGQEWHLPAAGVPLAWEERKGPASGVTVAVIDTGIATDHPDLSGIFVGSGRDFCPSVAGPTGSRYCVGTDNNPRPDDANDNHGTHVTGVLAAVGDNGTGVSGVLWNAQNRILPVKVFFGNEATGFTTADALASAVRWAAGLDGNPNGADIVNLSLGASQDSQTVEDAVVAAQGQGALLISAMGNSGQQVNSYPAQYSGVIGVGSVNSSLQRSCFSDYGPGLDLMAPGGDGFICSAPDDESIRSTFRSGTYGNKVGTSQASPIVAGIAALVWSDISSPTAAKVRSRLLASTYRPPGYNATTYGQGVLRADLALGFPGPGASVAVSAQGSGDSAVDTVTLDPFGGSDAYALAGLAAGSYTVEADAGTLSASRTVTLSSGQTRQLDLRLTP